LNTTARCWHCNAPVIDRLPITETTGDPPQPRFFCCAGCQAACAIIESSGLARYYQTRTQFSAAPQPSEARAHRHFDRTDVLQSLAQVTAHGEWDVFLLLENIRCSACVWLIEERLKAIPGVSVINVNAATGHARLVFQPKTVRLSSLLARIAELGYHPHVIGHVDQNRIHKGEQRRMLKRLTVAGFGMMQIMMISIALYFSRSDGMDPVISDYMRLTCMVVTAPVIFYSGRTFFEGAWLGVRAGVIGMDLSVSLGVLLAFGLSAINALRHQGEIYFESSLMFIFFLLLSRLIEMRSRHQAGSMAAALAQLLPAQATRLVRKDSDAHPESISDPNAQTTTERVALAALVPGDRIVVSAPEIIPADGIIEAGEASINESWLTGESLVISKTVGEPVLGASTLQAGQLTIRLTNTGSTTLLAQIVRLLLRSQSDRPRSTWMADQWARGFVTIVLIATGIVGLAWAWVDPTRLIDAVIAVLVISCPCALSLATPVAIAVTSQQLAKRGLFVTTGEAINTLAKIDTVVFDKTGTLTLGEPRLKAVTLVDDRFTPSQCLEIASALERGHHHPLQQAFNAPTALSASDVVLHPGLGIQGTINGVTYRLGRRQFVQPTTLPTALPDDAANVYLGCADTLCAQFVVDDALRAGMPAMVDQLQRQGLHLMILSGDHPTSVEAVARTLGITDHRARFNPEDKLALLKRLRAQGRCVLAVGDGINDAPLLQAADTSMAIATGASLTQAAAELIQRPESLHELADAIGLAKRTRRIIQQNLTWALAYNLIAIPLAALTWIPPWMAAIGMTASSIGVTLNALRLRLRLYSPSQTQRAVRP